jgi:hypothetical protein
MKRNVTAVTAMVFLGLGSAAAIAAELTTKTTDPGLIGGGPGGLDSGDEPWGYYEVSASKPVSGLVRIGAHHARRWNSNPANPSVQFDISEFDVDWDIEEMGLEIKVAYVPGYSIGVRFCALSGGNTGPDGAFDGLEVTGASSYPETQLATYDPSSGGGCKTVNVYSPVESGATEYTLMIRPQLQMVQETYWQYTIYGKITVEYYPVLGSR